MAASLLRFAELISSDVQRYFGRSQEAGGCDIYGSEAGVGRYHGNRRYRDDDLAQEAQMQEEGEDPGEEPSGLGPLADLFQQEQKSGRGLPMSQRRLPISFWTEPSPNALVSMLSSSCAPVSMLSSSTTLVSMLSNSRSSSSPVSTLSSPSTLVSTLSNPSTSVSMLSSSSTPVSMLSSNGTAVSMLSTNGTPVSMLSSNGTAVSMLSSSSTPDFSDLLAHWASDRDNNNDFSHSEYQLP
ncbi:uncharacterized protein percc1 [Alosa pseudoharengus]|uniref:uncharacterized protein percc1 n=1 Tax=Alosa pseudoharengus TaxID=34774 RepID=UPI003F8C997D